MIDLLNRGADNPVAVFIMSSNALAQLDKLTNGITGGLNDEADP